MAHHRPRRAQRPALAVRIARIGVPGLVIAGLATGTAAAVWPDHQRLTAEPAAAPSMATSAPSRNADRTDRDLARTPLPSASPSDSPSPSADASAVAKKAAEQKAADKRAAEKKAAEKKAAEKAAEKKAAEKKAAQLADFAELGDKDGSKYAASEVNVRIGAGTEYDAVSTLDAGDKITVTDRREDGWTQVVLDGKGRWVRSDLLTKKQPAADDDSGSGGVSGAACSTGSAVENGLTPDAIAVHRAICARFPQVKSYGGVRPDSLPEHPSGRALDAMISDSSVGWQIANWVRAHHQQLGVSQVIYSQQIWTVQRSSEGWRGMPDRGSATANHYDHVHVTVYGNAAG